MAIFRGTGGAGDSTTDATVTEVTQQAVNAAASATAAASSATSAATSASNASISAGLASDAQTGAQSAQIAAEAAQVSAETAETNAEIAQAAAESAQTSAESAQSYAQEWATQFEDTLVSTVAGGNGVDDYSALHHAAKASTFATESETSATNSEIAKTAAETAQGLAETAQANAETAQGLAETAQTAAETAQANAETAQAGAETAQGLAETAQANAETAQANAETAQGLAEDAQAAAEAVYDSFDDRYLGSKTSAPSTDNDGNTLLEGALYWNSTLSRLYVWDGSVWNPAAFNIEDSVASFNTRIGAITLLSSDVTTALGYTPVNKAGDTMTGALTLNDDPSSNLEAATKQYVDNLVTLGVSYHEPVRVEVPDTTGNLNATYDNGTDGVGATLTNAGTLAAIVIDGISLSLNDRVLIYNQTNAFENGIYYVSTVGDGSTAWVLTRATDADSYGGNGTALSYGATVFIREGSGSGELYLCNTEGTITFGTTDITFTQIATAAIYSAGTDLTLTGTEFSLNSTINSDTTGNAATATALETSRNITLTGDVTGTAAFDGTSDASIATTLNVTSANDETITLSAGTGLTGGGDFTTNQATPETITFNVDTSVIAQQSDIPTAVSELTNDSGYITGSYLPTSGGTVSGTLTLSQDGQDVLNFSANDTNDARGIAFNNRTALSADYNDGYLRLNQLSEFGNGVYTPGVMRADGGIRVDGTSRFTSNGAYIDATYNSTGAGGLTLKDSGGVVQSYWYGSGGGEGGLLDNNGHWFVRARTGTSNNYIYCDNNPELYIYTSYVLAPGSMRSPIFYDSNNTAYYMNPASTSKINTMLLEGTIQHNGDTNTYIQFHAADQFRVVTGGSERLEVNNSRIYMQPRVESPQVARSWVNFNGEGTVSIGRDYGVSSVTDLATGHYKVNFDTAVTTTYAAAGVVGSPYSNNVPMLWGLNENTPPTSTGVNVVARGGNGPKLDTTNICVVVFA
jgi:hypothetical protein